MSFGYDLSVFDQFYFPVGKAHFFDSDKSDIIVIFRFLCKISPREVVENHRKRKLAIRPEYGFSILPDFVGRVLFIRVCFHGFGVMGGFRRPDSNYLIDLGLRCQSIFYKVHIVLNEFYNLFVVRTVLVAYASALRHLQSG